MDPVGPISPLDHAGRSLFFAFKDVKTGYNHAYMTESQTIDDAMDAVDFVVAWYKSHNCTPKLLRVDSAKTFVSDRFVSWLSETHQIKVDNSVPYSHFQVPVERDIQTLCRGASTLLHSQAWIRADCWDLALLHFIDIRNRTPNSRTGDMSPHQIITKEVLDFSTQFKFAFGDVLAVAPPSREWKFDTNNVIGVYCGQPAEKHGALVYSPLDHSALVRYNCWKLQIPEHVLLTTLYQRLPFKSSAHPVQRTSNPFFDFQVRLAGDPDVVRDWYTTLKPLNSSLFDPVDETPLATPTTITPSLVQQPQRPSTSSRRAPPISAVPVRRSQRLQLSEHLAAYVDHLEDAYAEDDPYMQAAILDLVQAFSAVSKITVSKALRSDHKAQWIDAILLEVQQLIDTGTLVPIEFSDLAPGTSIIHSTMQLKEKLHQSGLPDKLKARLCGCGNELLGVILDTFSPTVGALSYATVQQIAVIDKMASCSIDVVGAYLYQAYPDDAPPLALQLPANVAEICGYKPTQLFAIKKYIYGLPDAGRAYYKAYSSYLLEFGFTKTASDPCLFVRINGQSRTYLFCHVDDTYICSTHPSEITAVQDHLRHRFTITVNDPITEYLGVRIEALPSGAQFLSQPKLLSQIIDEFASQLVPSLKRILAPQRTPSPLVSAESISATTYLRLLGMLLYMTKTRPDIATAVSFASTHASKPTVAAYQDLLHIVGYLRDTADRGLLLHTGTPGQPLTLRCYVDASYLTHSDSKSHSGYCMSFGEIGTFYSKSTVQKLVATSSTHAELRALQSLTIDIIFVVNLCRELGRPLSLPSIVFEDNQPVLDLTSELNQRAKRCKHFLMLIAFLKEQVEQGLFELTKVHTSRNIADILTKATYGIEFERKALYLLGISLY
jgi:hypothetical protein